MAIVTIDTARGGTLCVSGQIFGKGVTEIDETRVTIADVEIACDGLRWANVSYDGKPEAGPEGELDVTPAPREKALPVVSEIDVAAKTIDPVVATRAEKLAELVENDGKPAEETARAGEFPCTAPDCDKVLKSEAGRRQHVKLKHPEPDTDAE